jgi:hypothetical protein
MVQFSEDPSGRTRPYLSTLRVAVLPELQSKHLCGALTDELGIHLLTFTSSERGGIVIKDLKKLHGV